MEAHGDAAALGGELERVRDEVVDDLAEPRAVGFDDRHPRVLERQLDAAVLRGRLRRLDALADEPREVERLRLELELPRLQVADEEQVGHEAEQALGVAVDDAEEVLLLLGEFPHLAVQHRLDVADDRGQRRAQLVRDVGDELVLQPLRLVRVAHRPLEQRLQLLVLRLELRAHVGELAGEGSLARSAQGEARGRHSGPVIVRGGG